MAGTVRDASAVRQTPAVHNADTRPRSIQIVVQAPDGGITVEPVELSPAETHVVDAPAASQVAVHTGEGSATAPASAAPVFVVRAEAVVVSPDDRPWPAWG